MSLPLSRGFWHRSTKVLAGIESTERLEWCYGCREAFEIESFPAIELQLSNLMSLFHYYSNATVIQLVRDVVASPPRLENQKESLEITTK